MVVWWYHQPKKKEKKKVNQVVVVEVVASVSEAESSLFSDTSSIFSCLIGGTGRE